MIVESLEQIKRWKIGGKEEEEGDQNGKLQIKI